MSQFPHDQFAKDLLESLLSPFGKVETDRKISSEVREIDVCFFPSAEVVDLPSLGLLGRLATVGSGFEPFRNPASADEIRSCMAKLFDLHLELNRQAKRTQQPKLDESQLTKLWILTLTLAAATLQSFGAITDDRWGSGVYLMPPAHKTGIVVIHQLPATADTLWLRILGKQKVQQRAIEEINQLALDSPYRQNALQLLSDLRVVLERNQNRNNQDKELLMSLKTSQPYLDHIAEITQQSIQQGLQQGRSEQGRALVFKQLTRKLGNLSILRGEAIANDLITKINELSLDRIEALGEDLLDFDKIEDLEQWLDRPIDR